MIKKYVSWIHMKTKLAALTSTTIFTKTNLFYATIFALPMVTHGPQLLVGTAVNLFLFMGAKKLTEKELVLLAILPSLGAIVNGVLFGSLTMFLIYFAPAIWVSNFLLTATFKKLNKLPGIIGVIIASLIKSVLLYAVALTLFQMNVVPKIFLTVMGSFQLMTAVAGGTIALGINKLNLLDEKKGS
jgi:hypothetical protein